MSKQMRVFELAKLFGIETPSLLELCRKLDIPVKNQLSSVSIDDIARVEHVIARFGNGPLTGLIDQRVGGSAIGYGSGKSPADSGAAIVIRRKQPLPLGSYPGLERLIEIGEKAGLEKLDQIVQIAEADAESAMFKLRKWAENLCSIILNERVADNLNDSIKRIEKDNLLGRKAVLYLHQVRNHGNMAVHNVSDLFFETATLQDVNISALALAEVLDEAIKRGLVKGTQ